MRRALVLVAAGLGLLVLLLAVGFLLLARTGPEALRAGAERALSETLGVPVRCREASLGLRRSGIRLRLEAVEAGQPGTTQALSVAAVDARLGLWEALRGEIALRSLRLEQPHLRLRRGREGYELDVADSVPREPRAVRRGRLPTRLELVDAEIRLVEPERSEPVVALTAADLSLRAALLGGARQVALSAEVSGSALPLALPRLSLEGRLAEEARGDGADWSLAGDLHIGELRVPLDAALRLDAASQATRGRVRLGEIALLDFAGLVARQPDPVRVRLRFLEGALAGRLLHTELDWNASDGARLALAVADARLPIGAGDHLEALAAEFVVTRDGLAIRNAGALHSGRPLPHFTLDLEGLAHIESPDELRCVRPAPTGPLVGREALQAMLAEARGGSAPWSRARLELDWLEHPVLLCGVEQLVAAIEPVAGGLEAEIERAVWAGVPVTARARWSDRPEEAIALSVHLGPPFEPISPTVHAGGWASGRFETEATRLGPLAVRGGSGRLHARGSRVSVRDAVLELPEGSRLGLDLTLDLSQVDHVPYELAARVGEGELSDLSGALGFESRNLSGRLVGALVLAGELRPSRDPFAGARGFLTVHAREGVVRAELPLFVAVAMASEDAGPFAERDARPYRAIDGTGRIEGGRLMVDSLHLDAEAMRLAAVGELALTRPHTLDAMLGLHFFRGLDKAIGFVPVLNRMLLGKDENLVGAYFELHGEWPEIEATLLPQKTLASGPASFVLEGVPGFVRGSLTFMRKLMRADRGSDASERAAGS